MPCHCRNTVMGVLSVAKALSQAHTHTHTLWRRSCPFVMSFVFFQPPLRKSLLSFGITSRRWPLRAGKNRHRAGKILLQAWPPFESVPIECFYDSRRSTPPLRNYHPHQSPWSSMATLSKHALRCSSYFHNNQHGTFRPEYIINKCTKWTHLWQVDDYCPVLFLDSDTVLSGACKYLAYNVMLVFKYIFNSFLCHVHLGIQIWPAFDICR